MSADDDRARRLAAIQARLAPAPDPSDPSAGATSPGTGSSGSSTPLFGAPRHLPKGWTRPSEREEREKRRELARVVQRTIVRDSGYQQAAACVETLLKIATNIQNNPDPKFRTLKGDNPTLKGKVFQIPGGREFMIMMGFRTETRNFVQTFILDQSDRRMYELGLGADVLREALPDLQARVAGSNLSKTSHKAEEAARVAAAKRQIEEDRQLVADRIERERIGRDARAAAEAQAELARKAKEAAEEAEERRKRERREARGAEPQTRAHPQAAVNMSTGRTLGGSAAVGATATAVGMSMDPELEDAAMEGVARGPDEEDDKMEAYAPEPEDSDVDSDEGYWNQHRWGGGQKLGE